MKPHPGLDYRDHSFAINNSTIKLQGKALLGILSCWQRCEICFNCHKGILSIAGQSIRVRGADVSHSRRATRIISYSSSRRTQNWTLSPSSATNRALWRELTNSLTLASRSPAGYRLLRQLGSGGSGVVYSALMCNSKKQTRHDLVAVKLIPRSLTGDCSSEIQMAKLCPEHPTLLSPILTFFTSSHLAIVMPLVGSSLLESIHDRNRTFSISQIRRVTIDLLSALAALHSLGIAHRDVKLENICWDEASGGVKLCDFGLAACVPRGGFIRAAGTRYTQAPEVGVTRYGTAADIWSAGIVILIMLIRAVPPFSDEKCRELLVKRMRNLESKRDGDPLVVLMSLKQRANTPRGLLDLLRTLLVIEPSNRSTANNALAHPWLSDVAEEKDACRVVGQRRRSSLTLASLAIMKVRMIRVVGRLRRLSVSDELCRPTLEARDNTLSARMIPLPTRVQVAPT